MLFSWWFVVFLACYGFSGAQSNHEGFGGARSLGYGHYRADPGSGNLVGDGLDKAIDVLSTAVETFKQEKRSGWRSQATEDLKLELERKIKEAQEYADMMQKYVEQKDKKTRSGGWHFDYN